YVGGVDSACGRCSDDEPAAPEKPPNASATAADPKATGDTGAGPAPVAGDDPGRVADANVPAMVRPPHATVAIVRTRATHVSRRARRGQVKRSPKKTFAQASQTPRKTASPCGVVAVPRRPFSHGDRACDPAFFDTHPYDLAL